jgi:phosphonate dehydrogenase
MPLEGVERLMASCDVMVGREDRGLSTEELIRMARGADALVCFVSDLIDEMALAGCPRLQVVASFDKGHDNIDVDACTTRGIWVTVVPDLLTEPTADMAMGLMLALCRKIVVGDAFVRFGQFPGWHPTRFMGQTLHGKVLGIVGMGAIGRAVARRARGFDMPVLYSDPASLPPDVERGLGASPRSLTELLGEADIVLLAVPLTRETFHLLDGGRLALMKPAALLINICRGSVVDEEAVALALANDRLAGYAADVFALEDQQEILHPSFIPEGILKMGERTVLTPHLGTATLEVRQALSLAAAENVLSALRGERPPGAVNHVVPWVAPNPA